MMKHEFYYTSRDSVTKIHAIEWLPDRDIKGVLQICHGMVEYIDRYDEFACYLNERGWMVVGHDHLGHGKSVTSEMELGYFGHRDGNQYVIADIHALRKQTQTENPGVPYFMLWTQHGIFSAPAVSGDAWQWIEGCDHYGNRHTAGDRPETWKNDLQDDRSFSRMHYRSTFVDNMAFGGYNKKFEPARTKNDWLTKDTTIVGVTVRIRCVRFSLP